MLDRCGLFCVFSVVVRVVCDLLSVVVVCVESRII